MKKDNQKSQMVIYKSPSGETKIDVRFDGDTVWLTQNALAELFQTTKNNISLHVKNIFEEGELIQGATVKNYLTVQKDFSKLENGRMNTTLYPLEKIAEALGISSSEFLK